MPRQLLPALKRLSPAKRFLVALLALVVVLTWLAVCVILASYLVP